MGDSPQRMNFIQGAVARATAPSDSSFQRGDAEDAEISQRSGKPLTTRVMPSFRTGTLKLRSSPRGHSESRR